MTVGVDQFTVLRNSSVLFDDTFSDGAPPPSAPSFVTGVGASYSVQGTIPIGAESGGVLQLDSANGVLSANAAGAARRSLVSTLLTSTAGGATQLGIGDILQLSGTFGLTVPAGPLFSAYGIRFSDSNAGTTHQLAQLFVQFSPALAQAQITYVMQDFDADTVTTLGTTTLVAPAGADQIRLTLARPTAASNDFFGSFSYLAGGLVVESGNFAQAATLFQGESFVRSQFFAAETVLTPVPEPEVLWLMSLGAVFAVVARRRRSGSRRE